MAQIMSTITYLTGLVYLAWAVTYYTPEHAAIAWVYIIAEALCLWLFLMATASVWRLRFKPAEGVELDRPYDVDVLLPTCNEPINVIETTMKALSEVLWKGKLNVYVLDDGGSEEVEALATAHGFTYRSRPREGLGLENAKGGNLNFGLALGANELVLVLDADQVPQPDILERLAGYMRIPGVAFVQAKQAYVTHEGDPFYNSSSIFYDCLELGLDNSDTVISAGTAVLYRREALAEIDGFATWNLVEDLTTSYELHSRGWKSIYFSHPLSKGLSPTTIWRVYRQRGQWCVDTMRLFLWDTPFLKRGLSLRGKINYSGVAKSYIFSGVLLPFFFLIPPWTYLTGEAIFAERMLGYILIRGLYFLCMVGAIHVMFYGHNPAKQFRFFAGLFPVFIVGIVRALFCPKGAKKPIYRANNAAAKGGGDRQWPEFVAVIPQMLVIALNAVLPFYAIFAGTCKPRLIAGNAVLSAFCIWTLSYIVTAALRKKKWPEGGAPEDVYGPIK